MSEIAARYVSIYPKIAAGFSTEINAAVAKGANQGGKAVGAGMESAVKSSAPKIGQTFKSVVAPILTASAAVAILGFVRKSVDAFSQLEDATAAASVTFGDSMGKIESASESASKSLGISKQQYIDAAMAMGTFGKSAGLVGDDLAGFSTQMVQTAGDMASFRGTTPEQAIQAVGAALRGEMEPIRAYGVMLDDASLRQQALSMGLIKTTKEALTPQQKVLAAQAAILKQTSDAQGDFARTSDSTANTQKRLAAESANLSAEIGQKLAPSIVAAQRAGIGMLQWTSDNLAVIGPLAATVGTLTAAVAGFVVVGKGIEALKSARATIKGLGDAYQGLSTKAKVATVAAGGIGLALTAVSIGYGIWAEKTQEAKQQVEDMTEAVKADSGALGENARAYAANALQKSGALDIAQKLGISSSTAVDAALGEADAINQITAARQRQLDAEMAEQKLAGQLQLGDVTTAQDYQILKDSVSGLSDASQQAVANQKQFNEAVGGGSAATQGAATSANGAAMAFADYKKKLDDTYNAQLKLRGDARSFEAAVDDAAEAVKKNGRTLDINTEKGRANQAALDAIASSALSVAGGMTEADVASGRAGRVMSESRKEFIKAAMAMGDSKKEAEALADELGLLPSKKVIPVDINVKWNGDLNKTFKIGTEGKSRIGFEAGGRIRGGVPGKDSVPILAMPDEHMLTVQDVRNLGGHDAVFRMRSMAARGMLHFASGGPVMPSHNGHSLDWWQEKLLTDVEFTQLQIQIRDLNSSLAETETYKSGGKKRKRQKLRGLDRTEAELELRDANAKLDLAKQAAQANSSAAGSIADQLAAHEAAQKQYESTVSIWQEAAASLSKSAGLGSMDAASVKRTNAVGDVWFEKRTLTAADLAARVTNQAAEVETFIGLLGELRAAGASEALISDVMRLGTVDGTKAARLYLSDRTSMSLAESGYARLASASSALTAIGDGATVNVNVYEAATPQATTQAVLNGILAGRS